MNRFVFISVFLLSLIASRCATTDGKKKTDPGFQYFKISIEQNGTVLDILNNEVTLDRKPFTVVVYFTGPDGIFVNASFDSETFTSALQGKGVEDLGAFEGTGIVEELFNPNELLYINKKAPSFWQYTDDTNHRFNAVDKMPGQFACRRKVSNIMNLDRSNEKTDISKTRDGSVYLVFMSLEWNKDFTSRIERKRGFLKIVFQKNM